MPRRKRRRVASPEQIEAPETPQVRSQPNSGYRAHRACQTDALRFIQVFLMAGPLFSRRPLDRKAGASYLIVSRRDQRRAALSPRSARLPGGSPREFRPQAREPVPKVGSRVPASATTGQRLHGSSLIACGSFFAPASSRAPPSPAPRRPPWPLTLEAAVPPIGERRVGRLEHACGVRRRHVWGNSRSRISEMNRSIDTG